MGWITAYVQFTWQRGGGCGGDIYEKMPEVVPTSDKAIFSKMDLLLIKAELSTMLVHICDNVLSLFPISPLWPLTGSSQIFQVWKIFQFQVSKFFHFEPVMAIDEVSPCPYLFMPLAFCHILFPHPLEDEGSGLTWWAPGEVGTQLRPTYEVTLPWWSLSGAQAWPRWKLQQLECSACSAFLPPEICLGTCMMAKQGTP